MMSWKANCRPGARGGRFPRRGAGCFGAGLLLLAAGRLAAADVKLVWNPSISTNVAGYRIYFGAASRNYTNRVDTGSATNVVISGFTPAATYYFAATAYSADGNESPFSNEAVYTMPQTATNPPAPVLIGCAVRPQGAWLQWSSIPARSYFVLCKTNLSDALWMTDSPSLLAASNSVQWVDAAAGASRQKFYTILLTP